MADAKKCDRCKNYYTPTENAVDITGINVLRVNRVYDKHLDLCPDCAIKLSNFLNNNEEEAEANET